MNSLERCRPQLTLTSSIQILSRSYAVRYRECFVNETLVWQFKPIKKSINWAVWRKTDKQPNAPPKPINKRRRRRRRESADGESGAEERGVNLKEKLISVGMEEVVPGGRCEGGHVQKGSYNITQRGMYALVFGTMTSEVVNLDNTFSVNTSKTVFFILSNHPVSLSPLLRDPSTDLSSITDSSLATTFSGILYKKRRKKLQGSPHQGQLTLGYAKRYFTLSGTTGELSYSRSSHNPLLRGTIPLALAALNIDYGRREFILDSGADIWHLKASNDSEFEIWKTRLEDIWLKAVAGRQRSIQDQLDGKEISAEWKQIEGLVDRLEMMKDFVSGMIQDVANDTKHEGSFNSLTPQKSVDNLHKISSGKKDGKERKKLWKKKTPALVSPQGELTSNFVTNHLNGITLTQND
jgi:oxysterol-binding protein-related protein 3/6/7